MHSLTAIFDSEYYQDTFYGWSSKNKSKRLMWVKKREFDAE